MCDWVTYIKLLVVVLSSGYVCSIDEECSPFVCVCMGIFSEIISVRDCFVIEARKCVPLLLKPVLLLCAAKYIQSPVFCTKRYSRNQGWAIVVHYGAYMMFVN